MSFASNMRHRRGFSVASHSAPAKEVSDTRLVSKAALPRQRADALLDLFHRPDPDRAIDEVDANRTTPLQPDRTSQPGWQAQAINIRSFLPLSHQ